MKVGIKEISAATGFSPATVSNALNRKKGVNKDTAAKILKTAKELGYSSELSITKIRLVIYKKNGLIIEDTPFFSLIIDGFEKECRANGYEMALTYIDYRSHDYERQLSALLEDTTSAITLLGAELDNTDFERFKKAKAPIMTLDYWDSDMTCNGVFINNRDSARAAVEFLYDKGHRKIGYLRGNFRIKAFCSRNSGYRMTMAKHKLALKEEYIITLSTNMDGAYKDMLNYLASNPELPTAFFADNDMIALGAMKALKECGYRIPQDVSIIGFDDLPYSEISSPRLTSLRVPKQEMGKIAVRRMIEIIKHSDDTILKIQMCTEFIERDSVKDLNAEALRKESINNIENIETKKVM